VYGPESLNLGFIGAPLSMAISYNSVAVLTLFYVSISQIPNQAETDTGSNPSLAHDIRNLFLAGLAGIGVVQGAPLTNTR
jgi:hypothetical protein